MFETPLTSQDVFFHTILASGRFLRGFFFKKFWSSTAQIFFGKKNISYEEMFPKNFLAQNFLRKKKLEYSQPRKFSSPNFPGDKRKFLDHLIIELKSVLDEAYPFPVLDDAYRCTYTQLCSLLYSHMH